MLEHGDDLEQKMENSEDLPCLPRQAVQGRGLGEVNERMQYSAAMTDPGNSSGSAIVDRRPA
ncbi:hypothetical protein BJB45_10660 [Halomonas huangheensis]|uniref:Uncharacterized protein n=1 Tax=Halomonas huangheensis TaxID=1178482 RepID=W1NA70_9GAMM|nr:hypothetical protein BJB45_10660 [Halomonas huangheensis]